MKKLALALMLTGCCSYIIPEPYATQIKMNLSRDCLLDAAIFEDALEGSEKLNGTDIWHRILIIRYGNNTSHAMTIFQWDGRLWGWDDRGSTEVSSRVDRSRAIDVALDLYPEAVGAMYLEEKQ
jgi:hypothetical protein